MGETLTRRRFTIHEYHRMGETGIIHEDERVELIDGEIIMMAPIGGRHVETVNRANELFVVRLAGRAVVSIQNPVVLSERGESQPDLVVFRRHPDLYAAGPPGAADALLVLEVADSSLDYDRGVKLPRYAAAGIPEVWIVDLHAHAIEIYRDPAGEGYRTKIVVGSGGVVAPAAFPEVELAVDDIIP